MVWGVKPKPTGGEATHSLLSIFLFSIAKDKNFEDKSFLDKKKKKVQKKIKKEQKKITKAGTKKRDKGQNKNVYVLVVHNL